MAPSPCSWIAGNSPMKRRKGPVPEAALALRQRGLRLTPQRLLVLQALEGQPGHISAEEIFARVRDRLPRVHISTIYRTLEVLHRLGMVTETDLGEGKKRYHSVGRGQHHHLVCSRCGAVLELKPTLLQPLEEALRREYGFRASLQHFAIFGLCSHCQK